MTIPAEIEAVVFDMEGVLFDTEPLYEEAAFAACADLGYVMPAGLIVSRVGLSWAGTRMLFVEAFGPSFPLDDFVAAWLRRFDALTSQRVELNPGVHALVRRLDALAIPCAVATGAFRASVLRHLSMHALTDSFQGDRRARRLRDRQAGAQPVPRGGRAARHRARKMLGDRGFA